MLFFRLVGLTGLMAASLIFVFGAAFSCPCFSCCAAASSCARRARMISMARARASFLTPASSTSWLFARRRMASSSWCLMVLNLLNSSFSAGLSPVDWRTLSTPALAVVAVVAVDAFAMRRPACLLLAESTTQNPGNKNRSIWWSRRTRDRSSRATGTRSCCAPRSSSSRCVMESNRTNGRTNGAGNGPDGIRVRLHGIRSPYSLGRLPRPFPRRLPTLGHSPH